MKFSALLLLVTLMIPLGNPQNRPELGIKSDLDYLVSFYKDRHENPEISLEEKETSALLAKELRSVGYDVTEGIGGYGIVGILKNGDGPTILYRTDMDALPMYEKTELEYQSKLNTEYNGINVGTMHSCGHDMHMTTWLGTARAMIRAKDQWKGTLMLIGQPAEEIGMGSHMMLEAGLYDTFGVPDYGIALHCNSSLETGKIGIADGYVMANTESIDIQVFGVGAHGAMPHQSVDPVVIASMIVMDLQTIVSRNLNPMDNAVITVGAIKGGTKHNIIPDEVTLQLTVRTFKEEVRQLVHKRIKEISRGVAIAAGLPEDKLPVVTIPDLYTPSNYNSPQLVEAIKSSASKVIGEENIAFIPPQMVGEDFSRFGQTEDRVPTTLFWLGTVTKRRIESGNTPGLHSPYYFPDNPENTIETGVSVMTQTLLDLFKNGDS